MLIRFTGLTSRLKSLFSKLSLTENSQSDSDLYVLITDKNATILAGDDDSGPEDIEDDLDLECEKVKMITL